MDLLQLEYFLAVVRHEHVSRAADELRVAQPSLSRSLARLEHELGAPLFDRVGRSVRLNPLGRILAERAGSALGELAAARREIADVVAGAVGGTLDVASESLMPIVPFVARFRRQHPPVEFRLHQLDPVEMSGRLADGSLDVCFASQPLTGAHLSSHTLSTERVYAAVAPDHRLAARRRVTVAALSEEAFVVPRRGHWLRRLFDELYPDEAQGGRPGPRIVAETDEPGAVPELVTAGLGITLLPAAARLADTRGTMRWIAITDPRCTRRFTLVRRTDRYVTSALGTFEQAARAAQWPADRRRRTRA